MTMQDEVLEHLKDGIRQFQAEIYPAQAAQYKRVMSEPQRPHVLIITCADSRIQLDVLTQAEPGEVFVTRNIGNMVPAYGEMVGGVSAVLEFAVRAMQVRHIAVAGHTECGAMRALLEPASLEPMPIVKTWLRNAEVALIEAKAIQRDRMQHGEMCDDATLMNIVTERNVLLQMRHVKSHPSVAEAMLAAKLTVSGWIYDIAAGGVRICRDGEETFTSV